MFEPKRPADFLYFNLDFPEIKLQPAQDMLTLCREFGIGVKIGTDLLKYLGWIPNIVIAGAKDTRLFVDTKADDIPETTEDTLQAIFTTHPEMVNIHASSGEASMIRFLETRERAQSLALSEGRGSLALAVTILTSKSDREIRGEYNGRTSQ